MKDYVIVDRKSKRFISRFKGNSEIESLYLPSDSIFLTKKILQAKIWKSVEELKKAYSEYLNNEDCSFLDYPPELSGDMFGNMTPNWNERAKLELVPYEVVYKFDFKPVAFKEG